MAFFGLVWVASWVGCFFPSHHDLVKQSDFVTPNLPIAIASAPSKQPKSHRSFGWILSNLSATVSQRVSGLPTPLGGDSEGDSPPPSETQPRDSADWLQFASNFLFQLERSRQTIPVSYAAPPMPPERFASASLFAAPVNVMQLIWSWRLMAGTPGNRPSPPITVTPASATIAEVDQSSASHPKGFSQARLCTPSAVAAPQASSPSPARFQVRVRNQVVAEVATQQQANQIAQQLQQLDSQPNLAQLQPGFDRGVPAAKLGDRTLFTVDQEAAAAWNCHPEILAVDWVNALRSALDQAPFSLAEAQVIMHSLQETGEEIQGQASWYGPYFHGRQTATGETFDQDDLTAAHPSLPFDTYLKVTNLNNGKAVVVRINDRGPYVDDRTLDLSRAAARSLDSEHTGVVPITAVLMQPVQQSAPQRVARL